MKTLAITNQKGGVGKTTTCVNLAASLAAQGKKVLLVDLDPQGNATTGSGVDKTHLKYSIYHVLIGEKRLNEVVVGSEKGGFDVAPSNRELAGAEVELVSEMARETRLKQAISKLADAYDYVLLDCPPALNLVTVNALTAANSVMIPMQCEYYALEGLSQLIKSIEMIKKHLNPSLELSTILLTMYDSRTKLASQVADEVKTHFPSQVLSTIIPRSVRVSEAPSYGKTVISYDRSSPGAIAYLEAAIEIANRGAARG
jgi:chromosome partitioning protein